MLTKKLMALAALTLFATVAAVGLTRAADLPKTQRANCEYITEGDSVCPGAGAQHSDMQGVTPRNLEFQGGGTD